MLGGRIVDSAVRPLQPNLNSAAGCEDGHVVP